MKLIMENWRGYLKEQPETPTGIETFGQLKNLLRSIEIKRKGGLVGKKAAKYLAGMVLPGAVMDAAKDAKNMMGFVRSVYTADDNFKTQTGLDKLNVDDNVSKIVDDQIEAAFLKNLPRSIANRGDDEPIGDFDITSALQDYLAGNFDNTTVKK